MMKDMEWGPGFLERIGNLIFLGHGVGAAFITFELCRFDVN